MNPWQFWIDVGGTFTDCIARSPSGELHLFKLLSSSAFQGTVRNTGEALSLDTGCSDRCDGFFTGYQLRVFSGSRRNKDGARQLLGERPVTGSRGGRVFFGDALPPAGAEPLIWQLTSPEPSPVVGIRWMLNLGPEGDPGAARVRLGTTIGTNALLEQKVEPVALIINAGFGDLLEIGYQSRPEIFALDIRKPGPLYQHVEEISARMDAGGRSLQEPDEADILRALDRVRARGITGVAVCLLHSWRNPDHEEKIRYLAQQRGFEVSLSSAVSRVQKIVPRAMTTVLDAALDPVLRGWLDRIRPALPEAELSLMGSAGGLLPPELFTGKDSILSGPAGGVVGAAKVAELAGDEQIISFDMGGTSTDICRYAGELERRYEMELAHPGKNVGTTIVAPMLDIETVAAGGGSICWFDGINLQVGPGSAGATPGPACYGNGGPLTVTDMNAWLGRIPPGFFPFDLDRDVVGTLLEEMAENIRRASGVAYRPEELADGFLRVAVQNMADPVTRVSVARGHDLQQHSLVSFGGAGAQHACRLADELGIRRILQHPWSSLLSAMGIGMAGMRRLAGQEFHRTWSKGVHDEIRGVAEELRRDLCAGLGVTPDHPRLGEKVLCDLRYAGQDAVLTLPVPADETAREFHQEHQRIWGFSWPDKPVQLRQVRLELILADDDPTIKAHSQPPDPSLPPDGSMRCWFAGGEKDTPVLAAAGFRPGAPPVPGPCLVLDTGTVVVVEPGWSVERGSCGNLVLGKSDQAPAEAVATPGPGDPLALTLLMNRLTSIGARMGVQLRKTALSVNIKEREDYSCAVFSADGDLVVNAPHIPVHLGAMGTTIQELIRRHGTPSPGDVWLSNHPFMGGSHLNDVTVITPVFAPDGGPLRFFVANRAHHAEIGGRAPGSMYPFSKTLSEEGVVLPFLRVVHGGQSAEEELHRVLAEGPWPSRAIRDNLADVRAQIAANEVGRHLLLAMLREPPYRDPVPWLQAVLGAGRKRMLQLLQRLPPGERRATDRLEDGTRLQLSIDKEDDRLIFDFSGTGPVSETNLNANPAIIRACVLYCLRCLMREDIPLNDGVMDPVEVKIPPGSVLHPAPSGEALPAVAGGNVETSQVVVDLILRAFAATAASQGTMNNLIFGRNDGPAGPGFGFYETIGGGAGAGDGFAGADGVQVHMTNTRITDPEVLEERYPVRLRTFALRRQSGGSGRFPGGDGLVREFEFLQPMQLSLVTGRRRQGPAGLQGGADGQTGENLIRRKGEADWQPLPALAFVEIDAGDRLRLLTPGGGGFGAPGQ